MTHYAMPWAPYKNDGMKRILIDGYALCAVERTTYDDTPWFLVTHFYARGFPIAVWGAARRTLFETREKAMAYADRMLIDIGVELLDEEKAAKIVVLV